MTEADCHVVSFSGNSILLWYVNDNIYLPELIYS